MSSDTSKTDEVIISSCDNLTDCTKSTIYYHYKGDYKVYEGDYIVFSDYKFKYWVSPYANRVPFEPVRISRRHKSRSIET